MACDYKIIVEDNLELLESSVNIYINLGYIPVGGIFKDQGKFCQSLYRDDKDI